MYQTGDRGRWLADGNLEFLGRKDDQVKIRGHRIELGEIEVVLQQYNPISSVVVLARPDASGNIELVAYVVADVSLLLKEIWAYLSNLLPAYMIPSDFVQLEQMPLTPNGKIDKEILLQTNIPKENLDYLEPFNEIQVELIKIWGIVLGIENKNIGIKDDFFILGGNSIKLSKVKSKVYEQFNVNIEFKVFFQKP